jgi:hypothetical protein
LPLRFTRIDLTLSEGSIVGCFGCRVGITFLPSLTGGDDGDDEDDEEGCDEDEFDEDEEEVDLGDAGGFEVALDLCEDVRSEDERSSFLSAR